MKFYFLLSVIFFFSACSQSVENEFDTINQSTIEGDVGFLFFGDWGTGSNDQKAVANQMEQYCRTKLCQFVVGLGDNFYPAGVKNITDKKWKTHFSDVYSKLGLIFYSSLGNHDHDGNAKAQVEYHNPKNLWYMEKPYYQFSKGNVDFFALDTDPRGYSDTQMKWLDSELTKSKADWKVVYGHHPIYSFGSHGETSHLRTTLLPLLKKHKVDFYLAGHEHDKQVITSEDASDNTLYYISGTAAHNRPARKGPGSLFASDKLGFMHMKVRKKEAYVAVLDINGKPEFQKTSKK